MGKNSTKRIPALPLLSGGLEPEAPGPQVPDACDTPESAQLEAEAVEGNGGADDGEHARHQRSASDRTEGPGLATPVANPGVEDRVVLDKRLGVLSARAVELGRSIASSIKNLEPLWAELMPVLDEVEQILSKHSRRRIRRFANWKTWEEWRRWFLRESGLEVSDRTPQRRLKAFRERMEGIGNINLTASSPSAERYQMLSANLAANEFFEALKAGEDVEEPYAKYQAATMDSSRLRAMLAKCNPPRNPEHTAPTQSALDIDSLYDAFNRPSRLSTASSDCQLVFHPGDTALLAEYIGVEHGHQIETVFNALPPEQMVEGFEKFVRNLAQTYLHPDHPAGDVVVHVEYISRTHKPPRAA